MKIIYQMPNLFIKAKGKYGVLMCLAVADWLPLVWKIIVVWFMIELAIDLWDVMLGVMMVSLYFQWYQMTKDIWWWWVQMVIQCFIKWQWLKCNHLLNGIQSSKLMPLFLISLIILLSVHTTTILLYLEVLPQSNRFPLLKESLIIR